MEFTGERYVPGTAGLEELYIEHMSRYRFVRPLAAGRRVLDVGCGCGYGTHHLATGGARSALGIDISPETVAFSRSHYTHPNLHFAVMDASKICLRKGFDLVTCFELIEHVEDADGVLRGVRRVMDDAGIFVVSTPNKATYVAGGEDGKNPFHVREYHRDEFRDLLGGTFPVVRILGQEWVEGMALVSHPALIDSVDLRAGLLPVEGRPPSGPQGDKGEIASSNADGTVGSEPPYFIALCAKQPIADEVVSGLCPVAFYGRAVRHDGLKRAALALEREFDRRGVWAQGLEEENRSKDKTIESLRGELESLRSEFDERGRWAQKLNGELRQSGALVERLAEENRQMREKLAARRPAGWSKVAR